MYQVQKQRLTGDVYEVYIGSTIGAVDDPHDLPHHRKHMDKLRHARVGAGLWRNEMTDDLVGNLFDYGFAVLCAATVGAIIMLVLI